MLSATRTFTMKSRLPLSVRFLPSSLSSSTPFSFRFFSSAPVTDKAYYMLMYDYPPDVLTKRAPFREAHLKMASAAVDRDFLQLGGAWDPASKGVLVFRGTLKEVEDFARADPYVINGVVDKWEVKKWTVVVGAAFKK